MIYPIFAAAPSSVRDGALMEEELPAVVAEDPQRGAMRNGERGRGTVGGERSVLCQALDVVVAYRCRARLALEKDIDGLLAVEDAA